MLGDSDPVSWIKTLLRNPKDLEQTCHSYVQKFDENCDGVLEWSEIFKLCCELSTCLGTEEPRQEKLREAVAKCGASKDGALSETEFMQLFQLFLKSCINKLEKQQVAAASIEVQICTLGGHTQRLQLATEATWKDLQDLVAKKLGIPPALQSFAKDTEVLRVYPDVSVQGLGISPDAILTVGRVHRAWLWADSLGAHPSVDAWKAIEAGEYDYSGLNKLFAWVEDQNGEDSASEDLGAGVIYIPTGEVPFTSVEMLHFLAGANGEHLPVIPFVTGEKEEEIDMSLCPWIDIAELSVGSIHEIWPPQEKRPDRHYSRGYDQIIHAPSLVEATRSLVCAGTDATDEELKTIVAQCTFFACVGHGREALGAIKPESELTGFFKQDRPTPYVIICANHVKHTIAFAYQISYWV